jgi:hypothetical protein
MDRKSCVVWAAVCVAVLVTAGAAWFAHGQDVVTNAVPEGFRTPLVRDLALVDQVNALAKRVEVLEGQIQDMKKKVDRIK